VYSQPAVVFNSNKAANPETGTLENVEILKT
jgi:hypothetical protein